MLYPIKNKQKIFKTCLSFCIGHGHIILKTIQGGIIMFVMTMTKRRLIRAVMFILVLVTGIAIGVFAILSSIDTGAENIRLPIYCVKRSDNMISITFDWTSGLLYFWTSPKRTSQNGLPQITINHHHHDTQSRFREHCRQS